MLDKKEVLKWLEEQIHNPKLSEEVVVTLGVVYGLIKTGVFDVQEKFQTIDVKYSDTYSTTLSIVKCKECKWYRGFEETGWSKCCTKLEWVHKDPDDFCSWGEREDES